MIWRWSAKSHESSIGAFARQWLGGSMLDRLIPVTMLGWIWFSIWGMIGVWSMQPEQFFFCLAIGTLPWWFWLIDAWIDGNTVRRDVQHFLGEGAILATRCEYLGGHPQLPHGRFAYLTLEGTKENPLLNLVLPQPPGLPTERFPLPLLDLKKTKPEKGSDASPFADVAAAINQSAGKMFRPERLTLVVDYDAAGGRTHKVELTNFFQGNNEIRNWRNYMVCAQAQADTGVRPHAPWKDLKDEPVQPAQDGAKEPHAFSRNGHKDEQPSSAFARR
jgi:hypothetical protein